MEAISCVAILFDLDGVLIDSEVVVQRHWKFWAEKHGIPIEKVMEVAHGRVSTATIALIAPHLDAIEEGRLLDTGEAYDTDGLKLIRGAHELLSSLPDGHWGVVTSGNIPAATTRLKFGKFPPPPILVTSDDVHNGKPDPEAYLLGAQCLGLNPQDCIVIEDSPAGIQAAQTAGMRVIAVVTTHPREALEKADFIAGELANLMVTFNTGKLTITLKN